MNNLLTTYKGYKGLKTALFTSYYIALMPFIATILKLITNLFSPEPNILGFLHGQFYILTFLIPLIFICLDLYPIVMTKNKEKTSLSASFKTYPELYILGGFLIWCFIAGILQLIIFNKTNAFLTIVVPYSIVEGFPLFLYYGLCLLMAFLIKDRKIAKNIILIVILSSILLGITSIINPNPEYVGDETYTNPWSSLFLNSNHYGYFLTMCFMASATIMCIARKKWLKISAVCATSFLSIVMMLNNTFGCLIAVFFALILIAILLSIFKRKFSFFYLLPLGIFVIASFVVSPIAHIFKSSYDMFLVQFYKLVKELFVIVESPVSQEAMQAGTSRWELWLQALREICASPIIGNGNVTLRPHNEYLQYSVVWGIPSLILYLSAFVIIFIKALKYGKYLSGLTLVCFFSVIGYLASALFGNTMPHVMPYFMLFLGFLIRFINDDIKNSKQLGIANNKTANNS